MAPRILSSLLLALALLLAPLAMIGAPAMAHAPEPSAHEAHCAGTPASGSDEEQGRAILDCMSICSAIAADGLAGFGAATAAALPVAAANPASGAGVRPESEPPPPRLS